MAKNGDACNTKASKHRGWILTINNPTEETIEHIDTLQESENIRDLIGQHERGEEGTLHIQLFINWKNPRTFSAMKKLFPTAHIEVAENAIKCAKYCSKEDTWESELPNWYLIKSPMIEKALENGTMEQGTESTLIAKDCSDPMSGLNLREWQIKLMEKIEEEPDNREVIWYYDPKGGNGKTTLAKHLMLTRNDTILCTGSTKDSKFIVAEWMKHTQCNRSPRVIIYDVARCQDSEKVSYQTIEDLKNGLFLSTKYECKTVVYNTPHLIVFSNQLPNMDKLSHDRWNIIHLSKLNDIKFE